MVALFVYEVHNSITTFSDGTFVGVTFGLFTALSWIGHFMYYRVYGHPWKDSNGPAFTRPKPKQANTEAELPLQFANCETGYGNTFNYFFD